MRVVSGHHCPDPAPNILKSYDRGIVSKETVCCVGGKVKH